MKEFQPNVATIVGWTPDQWRQLEPDFMPKLQAVVAEAQQRLGLRVRFASGHRSFAKQQALRDAYEANLAWWNEQGQALGKPKPLPASLPGRSAHNWTRWVAKDGSFVVVPPKGKSDYVEQPASLAVDVMILDAHGVPIRVGGQVEYSERPPEWRAWADLLREHPELRDGGTFNNIDAVHVEDARWSYKTFKLESAAPNA